jgi:hypothetical protein
VVFFPFHAGSNAVLSIANWKRRTDLVEYCVAVVDRSIDDKLSASEELQDDPKAARKAKALAYSDQVKVRLYL